MLALDEATRDARSAPSQIREPRAGRIIVAAFAVSLAAVVIALPTISSFTPDSWTLYEMGRTIGHDFFRTNTAREYTTGSPYSSAFAPLWPVIVGFSTRLAGNIYGSLFAAVLAYVCFAVAAEHLARRIFRQPGIGLVSALLMLRFLGIRSELGGGRSLPMYLFVLSLLGIVLMQTSPHDAGSQQPSNAPFARRRAALLGLLAGAMVMTRFDAMPAALVVLLGAPAVGVRRWNIAVMLACFLAVVSPWVLYSLVHFHVPFATDNRWVAAALDPAAYVYDFHVHAPRSIVDDPVAWVAKLVVHVRPLAGSAVHAIAESAFLPVLVLLVALEALRRGRPRTGIVLDQKARGLIVFVLAAVAPIAGYLVTGYDDTRYFTVSIWLAELFALGYLARGTGLLARYVLLVFTAMGTLASVAALRYPLTTNPLVFVAGELDHSEIDTLVACLRGARGNPDDGVVFPSSDVIDPFKFGALTGWRVLPLPSNWASLDNAERALFLRSYGAAFVVGARGPSSALSGMDAVAVKCPVPLRRFVGAGTR